MNKCVNLVGSVKSVTNKIHITITLLVRNTLTGKRNEKQTYKLQTMHHKKATEC